MYSDQKMDAYKGATPYFTDRTYIAATASPYWEIQYFSSSLFIQQTYICLAYCFYKASDFYFVLRLRFG